MYLFAAKYQKNSPTQSPGSPLSPLYPVLQLHVNEPMLFKQVALPSHVFGSLHSSISKFSNSYHCGCYYVFKKKILCICYLRSFLEDRFQCTRPSKCSRSYRGCRCKSRFRRKRKCSSTRQYLFEFITV